MKYQKNKQGKVRRQDIWTVTIRGLGCSRTDKKA